MPIKEYIFAYERFHRDVATNLNHKYWLKDKNIKELKQGEIVAMVDSRIDLGHKKSLIGPFRVIKKNEHNSYLIRHMLLGTELKRNRKHLFPLSLDEKDRKNLESKALSFSDTGEILDKTSSARSARNLFDCSELQFKEESGYDDHWNSGRKIGKTIQKFGQPV